MIPYIWKFNKNRFNLHMLCVLERIVVRLAQGYGYRIRGFKILATTFMSFFWILILPSVKISFISNLCNLCG